MQIKLRTYIHCTSHHISYQRESVAISPLPFLLPRFLLLLKGPDLQTPALPMPEEPVGVLGKVFSLHFAFLIINTFLKNSTCSKSPLCLWLWLTHFCLFFQFLETILRLKAYTTRSGARLPASQC